MDSRFLTVIKTVCVVITVLLIGGIAVGFYVESVEDKKRSDKWDELYQRALPYNLQKWELEKELANLREDSAVYDSVSQFLVGFLVSTAEDIDLVKSLSEEYGFVPTVVIDCGLTFDQVDRCLKNIPDGWEIMLHTEEFSPDNTDGIKNLKAYLESKGSTVSEIFFLRYGYNVKANIEAVTAMNFRGFTGYHQYPSSGRYSNGNMRIDYSFLKSDDADIDTRVEYCYSVKVDMIFTFDMESLSLGAMSEKTVRATLDKLKKLTESSDCEFSTAAEVIAYYDELARVSTEKSDAFQLRANEINAQINELNIIIENIFNELNEN